MLSRNHIGTIYKLFNKTMDIHYILICLLLCASQCKAQLRGSTYAPSPTGGDVGYPSPTGGDVGYPSPTGGDSSTPTPTHGPDPMEVMGGIFLFFLIFGAFNVSMWLIFRMDRSRNIVEGIWEYSRILLVDLVGIVVWLNPFWSSKVTSTFGKYTIRVNIPQERRSLNDVRGERRAITIPNQLFANLPFLGAFCHLFYSLFELGKVILGWILCTACWTFALFLSLILVSLQLIFLIPVKMSGNQTWENITYVLQDGQTLIERLGNYQYLPWFLDRFYLLNETT